MKQDPSPIPENDQQPVASTENTCAEDATMHKLRSKSFTLLLASLRGLLVGAIRVCDKMAAQLKKE